MLLGHAPDRDAGLQRHGAEVLHVDPGDSEPTVLEHRHIGGARRQQGRPQLHLVRAAQQDPRAAAVAQLGHGALVHPHAAAHNHQGVHGLLDLAEPVAGDQHGAPGPREALQEPAQPHDALGVEAVGRFVEHEHLGVAEQGGGEREALAHTEGEVTGLAAGRGGEPDEVEHLVGAGVGHAGGGAVHAEVVAGRAARVEALRVQHRADGAPRVGEAVKGHAADGRRARGRGDEAEHHAQGGGLARAVGPQEPGDRARVHDEAEIADRIDGAELPGQVLHDDSPAAVLTGGGCDRYRCWQRVGHVRPPRGRPGWPTSALILPQARFGRGKNRDYFACRGVGLASGCPRGAPPTREGRQIRVDVAGEPLCLQVLSPVPPAAADAPTGSAGPRTPCTDGRGARVAGGVGGPGLGPGCPMAGPPLRRLACAVVAPREHLHGGDHRAAKVPTSVTRRARLTRTPTSRAVASTLPVPG